MRRGVLIAAAALLTVAAILGVLAFFSSRDDSTIDDEQDAPGAPIPELTRGELAKGNVEILYRRPEHREAVEQLAREFAGPVPDAPSLVRAGGAVLVRRGPSSFIIASAYKRGLKVSSPDDPALREFVEYWLGRGAMP